MPPVFYPTCKVRLQIRLESFVPDVLAPQTWDPLLGPEAFGDGLVSDFLDLRGDTFTLDIVPYSAMVELNSYRLADSAAVEVPFARLPFDPRIIRAATVQVFGGVFQPDEFAAAMIPDGDGIILPDVVPEGRVDAGRSNELFRGFVDNWRLTLSEGRSTVRFEARDMTGPLLDAELPPDVQRDIPQNVPLDQVVQLILTGDGSPTAAQSRRFGFPGFRGIKVVNETSLVTLPTVAEIRPPEWLSSARTVKKGRKGKGKGTSGSKVAYWDVISDLCVSAGFIVYVRAGTRAVNVPGLGATLPAAEVVISDPKTYYANDPTTGDELRDLDNERLFIYGVNAKDLEIERKLTGTKTPTVELSAFLSETGKQIISRFPPTPKNNRPSVGATGDREEIKRFNLEEIGGPRAQERLDEAAKSIYEQLGRGEMKVKVNTRHLVARLENIDDGIEADVFQIRAGDPVRIEVNRESFGDATVPAFSLFSAASAPERIFGMVALGVPRVIAARVALAMESPYLQTEFRCTRNTLSFDHVAGWDVAIEGVNYLDVRDSVTAIEDSLL